MGVTEIAWRNWVTEFGSLGTWTNMATTPPQSNILTPRTGELVMSANIASADCTMEIIFDGQRRVDVVVLINHNMVSTDNATTPVVEIRDFSGTWLAASSYVGVNSSNFGFQKLMFCYFSPGGLFDASAIGRVRVTFPRAFGIPSYGSPEEFTGSFVPTEMALGGIWAGPAWRPTNSARQSGFTQGITEQKRGATSIGGQAYLSAEARRRRMQITFPLLLDDEVYRLDAFPPSMQRVLAWAGTSRPIIITPDVETADAQFLQAIYGYIDSDPAWSTVPGAGYSASFSITEAL